MLNNFRCTYHHIARVSPLQIFGTSMDTFRQGHFPHTLFRFPLRNASIESRLSSTIYTQDKVQALFQSIVKEGHHQLLFLKKLESIHLLQKVDQEVNTQFVVRIAESCIDSVREKRKELYHQLEILTSQTMNEEFHIVYPIALERVKYEGNKEVVTETMSYIVIQYYGAMSEDSKTKLLSDEVDLKPMLGIALPIGGNSDDYPEGNIFCHLPLPMEQTTGLKAHINGNFALDQNRRNLQWPSGVQDNLDLADAKVKWNCHLVQDMLPRVYMHLAKKLVSIAGDSCHDNKLSKADVYHLFPNSDMVKEHWNRACGPIFQQMMTCNVFYTETGEGQWISINDGLFHPQIKDNRIDHCVVSLLQRNKKNIVLLPEHIFHSAEMKPVMELVSPKHVQEAVGECKDLPEQDRCLLLAYFLLGHHTEYLNGLKLLPVCDGSWMTTLSDKAFIPSSSHPRTLLPGLDRLFVDVEKIHKLCPHGVMECLEKIAESGTNTI